MFSRPMLCFILRWDDSIVCHKVTEIFLWFYQCVLSFMPCVLVHVLLITCWDVPIFLFYMYTMVLWWCRRLYSKPWEGGDAVTAALLVHWHVSSILRRTTDSTVPPSSPVAAELMPLIGWMSGGPTVWSKQANNGCVKESRHKHISSLALVVICL